MCSKIIRRQVFTINTQLCLTVSICYLLTHCFYLLPIDTLFLSATYWHSVSICYLLTHCFYLLPIDTLFLSATYWHSVSICYLLTLCFYLLPIDTLFLSATYWHSVSICYLLTHCFYLLPIDTLFLHFNNILFPKSGHYCLSRRSLFEILTHADQPSGLSQQLLHTAKTVPEIGPWPFLSVSFPLIFHPLPHHWTLRTVNYWHHF